MNAVKTLDEYERFLMEQRDGSITAEAVALVRAKEFSRSPEERICSDQFAIKFVNPELLRMLSSMAPDMYEEIQKNYEIKFPGHTNGILARVRFFDDCVKEAVELGFTQIIIMGAGYDTRAYRIEGIERVRVYEIDMPEIQEKKKTKVKELFGLLPDHVRYVPADLKSTRLDTALISAGYDPEKKTLYLMEGLLCYIPPKQVEELFAIIVSISPRGSVVLFDSFDTGIIDGTDSSLYANSLREQMARLGEPFFFGIRKGDEENFMTENGFRDVTVLKKPDYESKYFTGSNRNRSVSGLFSLVRGVM